MSSMDIVDAYQNAIEEFGGTYYVRNSHISGISLRSHSRIGGYFVADSRYEMAMPEKDFTFDAFNRYIKDYLNAFTFPGQYLGVWYDNPTMRNCLVYLDVSVHFTNEYDAIRFARTHKQISIWDIGNHESIVVEPIPAVV